MIQERCHWYHVMSKMHNAYTKRWHSSYLQPFFLKSLQPSTFDKRHFSFPGRLDVLDLKCCELVIFAKPPVRGNSLNDRPTVTPVRWRSKKEWTKDSSVVTPCPVSGNMPPIWPCREGRNPISSHLATRNRGPKPIFWVWFDWEGSVFLAAMLRKVPACNNLRIFRKEIQENRFSNFGCVFIQAFRHCFFTSEVSSVVAVQCCLRPCFRPVFCRSCWPIESALEKDDPRVLDGELFGSF